MPMAQAAPRRVLVVGTDDWAIEQSARALTALGHRVLRCHEPGEPAFPCNALVPGRVCPLDAGFDVAVTVRARPLRTPVPTEIGVTCALHARRPLVVAGMTAHNPFEPWATRVVGSGSDIATACEEAVGSGTVVDIREAETPLRQA